MRRIATIWILVNLMLAAVPVFAQDKLLTLDDLYDPQKRINFNGTPPLDLQWLPDGQHFLQRKKDDKTGAMTLWKVSAATGEATRFHDPAAMQSALLKLAGFTQETAQAIAQQGRYTMNADASAALINHADDLYYYHFGNQSALRLTASAEEEVGEEFSPDGRFVSFVRNYNLYVVDIATQQERALTQDGGPQRLNGRLDWVYQEEIYGRGNFKGYWWSPDSTKIAYLQLDESMVKPFTVVNHIPYRLELEVTPYPKAGDPNPVARLGVVKALGGATQWVDLFPYQAAEFLIVKVNWTPNSQQVVYQVQNRQQTWLDLNLADAATGQSRTILRETSKAWVNVLDDPHWLADGSFLWLSERTGRQHLYHYAADGKLIRQITNGAWDIRAYHGLDEAQRFIYFSSSEHSPIGLHAYRIRLDGAGLTRLTKTEGWHRVDFNPPLSYYIDYWSDWTTPTQVRLHHADGRLLRLIDENRVEALKQYKLGKTEFMQVKTRDGFVMEAMMIKPPDFDPRKKYPVMCHVYGGPQAPLVRNGWGGTTYMWHQMLAQKGYIIWVCDNRTASNKGVESAWPVYRRFGELELQDLEDGLSWLKQQPYVDATRIGLWGWSYGGFLTAYALTHSRSFKIGIAGAPVTDWRNYDTIYTERYMDLPQNNPDGYKKSSPVFAAENLSGRLLLIHGTIDDNVHMQNTIQFVYALQKAGKQFDLMLYPQSRHGVTDPLLVKHLRTLMTNFILERL
ncbi:MAG: S9 family peptidase [Acidobacteriota bacterium]|nr:S9 family peptidase [Blastocatellia bacterium]MDW8240770.1 S9 family peptidase [Acidobacteriota bacterium]